MIDNFAKDIIEYPSEINILSLLRFCIMNNFFNIGIITGNYFSKIYPTSFEIRNLLALCFYKINDLVKAYNVFNSILDMRNLPQNLAEQVIFNAHFSIDSVADRYINYNSSLVHQIMKRKKKEFPLITFTITTCKRFDLFEKTINSFINCFLDIDLIDTYICIDDNSSEQDRFKMKKLYPFFTFILKDEKNKGHSRSMNILRNIIKTPYVFHMEDDWKFIQKKKYLSECLDVLGSNDRIGQCLINKNYSETEIDIKIKGGEYKTTLSGQRYYIHEYANTEEEIAAWKQKHIKDVNDSLNSSHCYYWPGFSFRPSLLRTHILQELGPFNETIAHFEMDYSYKYQSKKYISAFLETIYCLHTGRLTSERFEKKVLNAYDLNNEKQFENKEIKITDVVIQSIIIENIDNNFETFVVNLDKRQDRWDNINNIKELSFLNYKRFSAINGTTLKPTLQLQRIFDNNDYNMKRGMVGCAISHIKLMIELINSSSFNYFCILEDDITVVPDFTNKFKYLQSILPKEWDLVYLGHHAYDTAEFDKTKYPSLEKWDSAKSLSKSKGGTGGYLISKQGANKLLKYLDENGLKNCIDTMQQKSADILNIHYAIPHLIYSECFTGTNIKADTDIQTDHTSLTSLTRFEEEMEYYKNLGLLVIEIYNIINLIKLKDNDIEKVYIHKKDKEVNQDLYNNLTCKIDNVIYTVYNETEKQIYYFLVSKKMYQRILIGDTYNIDSLFL